MAATLDKTITPRIFSFAAEADAKPIGLTRIYRNRAGVICFGADEPAQRRWEDRRVQWLNSEGREVDAVWYRHEVLAQHRGPIKAADTMMACRFPLSRLHVDHAIFKRGSKKSPAQRPNIAHRRFESEKAAKVWLESLPNDYWEKGHWLVAGVSIAARKFSEMSRSQRRSDSGYAYGVTSEPILTLVEDLYRAPVAQALLRWTRQNTLRSAPLPAARRGKVVRLDGTLQDDASALLTEAIYMALCGPQQEGVSWTGKPVLTAVDSFYRNLVHDRYRTTAKRRKELSAFSEPSADPP